MLSISSCGIKPNTYTNIPIWITTAAIFIAVKYQCSPLVLWRKTFMPKKPPIPPPNTDRPKSTFSGILHAFAFAFNLSKPYAKKVIKDITPKTITYIKASCSFVIKYPLF